MTAKQTSREPKFTYSLSQVSEKSAIAAEFLATREALNQPILESDNKLLKRIYNVDTNAYLPGILPSEQKELLGLVASTVLRCDDCVFYHIIQCYRLDTEKKALEEALNIACVVGGTIVIPHLRRAYSLIDELYKE